MRLSRFFLSSLPLLFACSSPPASETPGPSDASSCPAHPDLASPSPTCAAAIGLRGDSLLCVDFKDVSTTSMLAGWDFSCTGGASWTSAGGKLQVNNFKDFSSTCSFSLPPLPPSDFLKFSSFTLSVIHRVDLNSNQQKALIMLGGVDEQKRLLDWKTGPQPRQSNVYSIAKADLPLAAQSGFQPLFQLTSGGMAGTLYAGWQIESIAILGLP